MPLATERQLSNNSEPFIDDETFRNIGTLASFFQARHWEQLGRVKDRISQAQRLKDILIESTYRGLTNSELANTRINLFRHKIEQLLVEINVRQQGGNVILLFDAKKLSYQNITQGFSQVRELLGTHLLCSRQEVLFNPHITGENWTTFEGYLFKTKFVCHDRTGIREISVIGHNYKNTGPATRFIRIDDPNSLKYYFNNDVPLLVQYAISLYAEEEFARNIFPQRERTNSFLAAARSHLHNYSQHYSPYFRAAPAESTNRITITTTGRAIPSANSVAATPAATATTNDIVFSNETGLFRTLYTQ